MLSKGPGIGEDGVDGTAGKNHICDKLTTPQEAGRADTRLDGPQF